MAEINENIDCFAIANKSRYLNVQELMMLLRSDFWKFASWGAHAFHTIAGDDKEVRGFRMKVQGHHHKGHVYIFVNGLDLFDVYYTTVQGKIIKTDMGLYFDMLVDCIDRAVEKIPAYKD